MQSEIRIIPIQHMGEISKGDNLAEIVHNAAIKQQLLPEIDDIFVVTQKIVSKAEDRILDLATITPSAFAKEIAKTHNKDAAYIEVVLQETKRIVRMDHGVLICETHQGFICANAGVDESNIKQTNTVSLLPQNPNNSATNIRNELKKRTGKNFAVIISDSWGRPWREGQVNVAIGSSGIAPLVDYRGQKDQYGYTLHASILASTDELAGAAELVMGKQDNVPVTLIRGYHYSASNENAQALLRDPEIDMFR